MAEEFDVKLDFGLTLRTFLHSQFLGTPADPKTSFSNQTVVVTGSNVGLGFEAARHFYRLNCAKLILAVRTVSKGEAAKEDIVLSVKHRSDGAEAIEVWPLDLSSTKSTLAFADRVKGLTRLDAMVENAGIFNQGWFVDEGFEQTIQVNVLNTFLLALSVLPKLAETKQEYPDSSPHLEIVSSEAHRFSNFKELNSPDIYATLNDEKKFELMSRSVTRLRSIPSSLNISC
jgi:NAD(P)-dependent dehydrogenase (short-subunit alcohol dehydrogenase family)